MILSASLLLLSSIIFLVAVVFSLLGQGGGTLYTPVQVLFGVDFHTAATTSLFLIMVASLSATLVFRKAKKIDWSLALVLESVTTIGGFIGGFISGNISGQQLSWFFSALVAFAAIFMIHEFKQGNKSLPTKKHWFHWVRQFNQQHYTVNLLLALPISFFAGLSSGLVGVGGGILKVPLMVLLLGIPMDIAVGSSALMVGLTATGGFAGHLVAGHWDWKTSLILGVAVFIGGQIGARKALSIDKKKMKKLFGWFLLGIALLMVLKNSPSLSISSVIEFTAWQQAIIEAPFLFLLIIFLTGALFSTLRHLQKTILQNNIYSAQLLGAAVALRDHGTAIHNFRVAYGSCLLGEALGLSKKRMQGLMKGAFLHDIGKIGIDDEILKKRGSLKDTEFKIMQQHVMFGVELLEGQDWFKDALDVVHYHHEKYDGSGYLEQLSGKDIPEVARIFTVIDVFDALMSKRPYKEALSYEQSIEMIKQKAESHFDPNIVKVFVAIAPNISQQLYNKTDGELRIQLEKKRMIYFGV